jgi:hypothetical protein
MKKLLFFLLLLVGVAAQAQTTYTLTTVNPLEIVLPDTTNTHIIQLPTTGPVSVRIQFASGNSGTVRINAHGAVLTNSPEMSATTDVNGISINSTAKTGYKIRFRGTNAGDILIVTIW